jgi:peroxiredoxin
LDWRLFLLPDVPGSIYLREKVTQRFQGFLRVKDMTATRSFLAAAAVVAVLLTGPACRKKAQLVPPAGPAKETATETAGQLTLKIAPEFSLMDSTGRKVSLSDYEGSIVVLEWMSYECPYVAKYYEPGSMIMVETAQKYADRNVIWLAINSTYTATAAKNEEWRQKNGIPYPVLDDHVGTVGQMYFASHTPQVVVMDKERRIIYYGAMDNDVERKLPPTERVNYVDKALSEFLSGRPVATPRTAPAGTPVKYAPASAAMESK